VGWKSNEINTHELRHAEQLSAASARELEQQEQQLKNAGEQPNEHSAKVG